MNFEIIIFTVEGKRKPSTPDENMLARYRRIV
jgi:hypothetical protein